jgi:hypothetical protein
MEALDPCILVFTTSKGLFTNSREEERRNKRQGERESEEELTCC